MALNLSVAIACHLGNTMFPGPKTTPAVKQHFAQPSTPAASSYIHLLLCSAPFDCPKQENQPLCNFRNQQFLSGPQMSLNKTWLWCISRRERSSSDPHIDSALHPATVQFWKEQSPPIDSSAAPVLLYNKQAHTVSSSY